MHRLDRLVYDVSGQRYTAASLLICLPVVQLTSVGARSGKERTVPLLGIPQGEDLVLIASNWSGARNPGWYYNLRANPRALVARKGVTQPYVARETTGAEREALWQEAVRLYGGYEAYRRRTGDREIPVLILTPAAE